MPFRKDKARQIIVKNLTEFISEEIGGEIVPSNNNNITLIALIPGFFKEQITDLMIIFSIILNAKLKQRLRRFDENRQ